MEAKVPSSSNKWSYNVNPLFYLDYMRISGVAVTCNPLIPFLPLALTVVLHYVYH